MPTNTRSNHIKNILHGFFMTLGLTIAEPNTILPIIVTFFGGGAVLVGLFSALLKGGAIVIQLYAAFRAQEYPRMLPYFHKVLFVRFLSWFLIGIFILIFGEQYHEATLWAIGIGLFIFSFSAGFGAIYFKEITAKIFTHKFRGYTMSVRQFFSGFGAIISGGVAGYMLSIYEAPFSFGVLFVASSFIMGLGYLSISLVDEPTKEKTSKKEKTFKEFLKNAKQILKNDKELKFQVLTFFFAYSYLLALPFVIVEAKDKIELTGEAIGYLITSQMSGAMLSNILWGKLSAKGKNKLIAQITIFLSIASFVSLFFINSLYGYLLIFFTIGGAMDGNRLSSSNLLLIIAPEEKRPVYSAIQINILSFGIFFSIVGGYILHYTNYTTLYSVTIAMLLFSFFLSFKLQKDIS